MKAVILAGGKGTRLYPLTLEVPKPLITVQKRPIISHQTDLFSRSNVDEFFILINKDHIDDFSRWQREFARDLKINFIIEQEALGTFGGLPQIKERIGGEPFFMTNGDELKNLNLRQMADFHKSHNGIATIALVEVENPSAYGVAVCDEENKICRFLEKPENPPSRYISSGLYLLDPEIFNYYPYDKPAFSMVEKDLFPKLANEGKLFGHKFQGQWFDCGTFERWEKAIKDWQTP
jgi:NDP-sugar pyrophosphorylase family protein